MRPRISKPRQEIPLSVGLHLATIWAVNYARKSTGEIITDKTGDNPAIEITFRVNNVGFKETFHTTPASQWIWDNLSNALQVDNKKEQLEASQYKGRQLWIIIAGKVSVEGNDLRREPDGSIYMEKVLRMKFYQYIPGSFTPAILGDPEKNNGIPSGEFLINQDIDLRQFVDENVKR